MLYINSVLNKESKGFRDLLVAVVTLDEGGVENSFRAVVQLMGYLEH